MNSFFKNMLVFLFKSFFISVFIDLLTSNEIKQNVIFTTLLFFLFFFNVKHILYTQWF
jgi:hypothetical protein